MIIIKTMAQSPKGADASRESRLLVVDARSRTLSTEDILRRYIFHMNKIV